MAEGPERFGGYCGCSDSREVWKSFSSMPAPFSANSTLPIAALLASEASRAVLASEVTPASICARSGATDTVASPLTEITAGGAVSAGAVWASAGAVSKVSAAIASGARVRARGGGGGGGGRERGGRAAWGGGGAMLHEPHFSGT